MFGAGQLVNIDIANFDFGSAATPAPGAGGIAGRAASQHLDMVRGLAAIAVLYSHARVMLIQSMEAQYISPVARVLYILSNYGHASVMIFFVLSGYLISRSIVRDVAKGRWAWRSYLIARNPPVHRSGAGAVIDGRVGSAHLERHRSCPWRRRYIDRDRRFSDHARP